MTTVALLAALGWTLVERKPVAMRTDHPTATADKPAIKVRSAANLKLTGWNGPADKGFRAVLKAMESGQHARLTPAEIDAYLARHGRDAPSLVVASRLTDDLTLLREAIKAAPGDALGHLELALRSEDPVEKKAAVEAFRALQPDNPLGNYLGAQSAFAAGITPRPLRTCCSRWIKARCRTTALACSTGPPTPMSSRVMNQRAP